MKLYKVEYPDQSVGHQGYSWHGSKREAQSAAASYMRANRPEPESGNALDNMYRNQSPAERPIVEAVEFRTTKAGILSMLTIHATHPDNG